jgi:serine/threonine protein kinase
VHKCKSAIHLDDDYTIVTELIEESCTLWQFIVDATPLDGPMLKLVSRNLIEALQQCHEAGVYHCDIKETNILIHPVTKVPTLIDFGLAALAVDSPYWGSCGTEGYKAPEIVANLDKWDGKTADIFALGVVLKNMYRSSVYATALPTDFDYETKSSDLSSCRQLIEAMLQISPSDRPSIEKILRHPWLNDHK